MNIDFCIRIEKQEKLLTVIPKKRLGGRNTALAWFSFAINFIYDLSKEILCIFSGNRQFFLFFYALPDRYYLKSFKVDEGTMIQTAILQSGILQQFTEIDLRENKVGIYSRPAKLTDQLKDGDRIEIYRPLLADPKEIRRKRAAEQAKAAQEKAQQEKQEKE